jgi:hypothetical protein
VDGAALRSGHCPPLESGLEGKAGSRREPEVRDTGRASAITGAIWAGIAKRHLGGSLFVFLLKPNGPPAISCWLPVAFISASVVVDVVDAIASGAASINSVAA